MTAMTPTQKSALLGIQGNLLRISLTGKASINLRQYERMGLVRAINKMVLVPWGEGTEMRLDRLTLTEKGRRVLEAMP